MIAVFTRRGKLLERQVVIRQFGFWRGLMSLAAAASQRKLPGVHWPRETAFGANEEHLKQWLEERRQS